MADDWRAFWTWFGASFGACLIAYAFIVVLMTASAQQTVVRALSELEPPLDYSSALVRLKEAESLRADVVAAEDQRRRLSANEAQLVAEMGRAKEAAEAAWARFRPLAQRASREPGCAAPSIAPEVEIWNAVLQCAREESLSPRLARQVVEASTAAGAFGPAYTRVRALNGDLVEATSQLRRAEADLGERRTALDKASQVRAAFAELNVIRRTWLFAGGILVDFPPTLMQIILASVAGAFGALLITLVLVVYPKNDLKFVQGKGHGARIMLGALISLCVFVVLGAGTTVLGGAEPFDGQGPNVMTFSAVGILAGMFSDRVAGWLSDKAGAFFRRDERDADDGEG